MDTKELLAAIDSEMATLLQARALLTGTSHTTSHRARVGSPARKKQRSISAEGRARIAAAQKARWAKQKKAAKKTA